MTQDDDRFNAWIASLEARHLSDLTFSEVSRALRALSSAYVERRDKLSHGAALSGAGKRAAFALFYGPLHYLLLSYIIRSLGGTARCPSMLFDLGCGTGASGAAWATECASPPRVVAIDRHPWALGEASATYRAFAVSAQTRQIDFSTVHFPKSPAAILAAFAINEIADEPRDALLPRLLARANQGDQVLVVEPIAGFVARWWGAWRHAFESAGGRADEWRVRAELPAIVRKLDRAAGLDHRELTGRSLSLNV